MCYIQERVVDLGLFFFRNHDRSVFDGERVVDLGAFPNNTIALCFYREKYVLGNEF